MKYAHINSVDVECRFSMYINIPSDNLEPVLLLQIYREMVINSFLNLNQFLKLFYLFYN